MFYSIIIIYWFFKPLDFSFFPAVEQPAILELNFHFCKLFQFKKYLVA